jgi:hypothetical protein
MNLFHVVDDQFVILRSKGIFKQTKLYQRGDDFYAGWAGGYVRLLKHGTSNPNVAWVEIPEGVLE